MRFMINPSSLLNKLGRSYSKKSCERLLHEDGDQIETTSKKEKKLEELLKKARGSTPKEYCKVLVVGKEEKKYPVSLEYLSHPKFQELLDKYRELVFDPRIGDPFFLLECPTETFEQVLRYVVKNH